MALKGIQAHIRRAYVVRNPLNRLRMIPDGGLAYLLRNDVFRYKVQDMSVFPDGFQRYFFRNGFGTHYSYQKVDCFRIILLPNHLQSHRRFCQRTGDTIIGFILPIGIVEGHFAHLVSPFVFWYSV